jgi:hypothetical protein
MVLIVVLEPVILPAVEEGAVLAVPHPEVVEEEVQEHDGLQANVFLITIHYADKVPPDKEMMEA